MKQKIEMSTIETHTEKNDMTNFMEYKLENLTDMIDQPDDGGW